MKRKEAVEYLAVEWIGHHGCATDGEGASHKTHEALAVLGWVSACPWCNVPIPAVAKASIEIGDTTIRLTCVCGHQGTAEIEVTDEVECGKCKRAYQLEGTLGIAEVQKEEGPDHYWLEF